MSQPSRIVVPARMSAFDALARFLDEHGRAEGLAVGDALRLRLVTEELFTNTVRHGHRGGADDPVEVTVTVAAATVTLVYADTAPLHDPRESVRRTLGLSRLVEGQVGGLGMRLVAGLAGRLEYAATEGRNRVTLVLDRTVPGP